MYYKSCFDMKKIALMLTLFSILLISLISSVCIPAFEAGEQGCIGFSCVNESMPQHISERLSFFIFLPISAVFFVVFVAVAYGHRSIISIETFFYRIRILQKRFCTKLFNFIIEVFSGGILHAKIPALS